MVLTIIVFVDNHPYKGSKVTFFSLLFVHIFNFSIRPVLIIMLQEKAIRH